MALSQFQIASCGIKPNLVLAPMSGVTSLAFRLLIRELNPDALGLVVSEFISVEGLTRGNAQSFRMMEYLPEERPVSIQIFGHEISRMVDAAKMVQDAGADIVDVNCGCPVPKVVRKGGGCELMRQPEHLEKMLRAMRAALTIPLTIKIRAGWDETSRNAVAIAKLAEDCGVDMLAVHGRTRQELYRGDADWTIVSEVANAVKIPVIGSGDVLSLEAVKSAVESGVAGVMIGRGALGNPWIFKQITDRFAGKEPTPVTAQDICWVLNRYLELLLLHGSPRAALGKLKQLASQATRMVPAASMLRRTLCRCNSLPQFQDVIQRWQEAQAAGEERAFLRSFTQGPMLPQLENFTEAASSQEDRA